ncbi:MAG: 3-phosphoshikimate 1-carboxyvinyltransferase [Firmicutes bacterium]|nr:3-phosphoshikimate 1-carboxyvinyltransferase [Bacillota bacterium]
MAVETHYQVPVAGGPLVFSIEVPGSKSITNRALLIAALCDREVRLSNVLFSDDSAHFMDCLSKLGFKVEVDEAQKIVKVRGEGGSIPKRRAEINVGSAGTAARFLTAFLAVSAGEYLIDASPQMAARPMKPLLEALKSLGARFEFLKQPDCLPLLVKGAGSPDGRVTLQANISSQFLSALLLVGCLGRAGLGIELDGDLAARPYVEMTLRMMRDFGVAVENDQFRKFKIPPHKYRGRDYSIEPDVSNANYFWATAVLTGGSALVKGVTLDSLQGDIQFLEVFKKLGSRIEEREGGIRVEGPPGGVFPGIEVDLGATPDQTLTLAALAPYASSPTIIKNVGLIKYHESNRMEATINELQRAGIRAEEYGDGLIIYPGKPRPAEIETYNDHRVAMAFALLGLRTPGIRIKNPDCTGKTFKDYFKYFDRVVTVGGG